MLVLGRYVGQTILIGEKGEIRVTILACQGRLVRLGVDAPAGVPIHRKEVFDRIQDQ